MSVAGELALGIALLLSRTFFACGRCACADDMARSQSRSGHPCALGPRLPCRGTLCSSVHIIRVSASALSVKKPSLKAGGESSRSRKPGSTGSLAREALLFALSPCAFTSAHFLPVGGVPARMIWPDRKVAQGIHARSARDFLVAGRFALRSISSAFQLLRCL